MRIAVAGGTGLVGRYVAAELRAAGHEPVVITRSAGADVITGAGLDAALDGAAALVDVTNTATMSGRKAVAFFTAGTRNLLAAGHRAGVAHHVVLSIVGIGRPGLTSGYNVGKVRQESLVRASGGPVSIMRATQFHQFIPELLDRLPGPVQLVPRMRIQPVAAGEVAAALAALAAGPPAGLAPEIAGPEPAELADLARQLGRARGRRRPVLRVPVPGAAGRAMASGAMLPSGPGLRGMQTFADWLASSPRLVQPA
ncbi:MAG: SDR family oxidoreductase [Streptosporangiaceae bacterium]